MIVEEDEALLDEDDEDSIPPRSMDATPVPQNRSNPVITSLSRNASLKAWYASSLRESSQHHDVCVEEDDSQVSESDCDESLSFAYDRFLVSFFFPFHFSFAYEFFFF